MCKKNFDLIDILKVILQSAAILYGLARSFKNIYFFEYSIEAEKFYGIPSKYFYENVLGDINFSLILVFLFIVVLLSPSIIKKCLKKSRLSYLEAIGYSAVISVLILYILLTFAIEIIDKYRLAYINNSMVWMVVISILILGFTLVSFFVYIRLFTREDDKTTHDKDSIDNQETQNVKGETEKIFIVFPIIFVIVVTSLLFVFKENIKLPSNTKSYEVVLEENAVKKIVVGEYKGSFILMDVKKIENVKQEGDKKSTKLVFGKYFYELKEKENLKIGYVNFEQVEGQVEEQVEEQ